MYMSFDLEQVSNDLLSIQRLTRGFLTLKHMKSTQSQPIIDFTPEDSLMYDSETIEEAFDLINPAPFEVESSENSKFKLTVATSGDLTEHNFISVD